MEGRSERVSEEVQGERQGESWGGVNAGLRPLGIGGFK